MEETIIKIVKNVLDLSEEKINRDSSMMNIDEWDSITHMQLLFEISRYFKIDFESFPAQDLTSIEKICKFLYKKGIKEKISCMSMVMLVGKSENKILLLNSDGEWVFPKGHVENNESFLQCAIRELKEESGILLIEEQSVGQIDEFRFYFDNEQEMKIIKVYGFLTNKEEEIKFNQREHFVDAGWFELNNALSVLSHEDAKHALKKFIKRLNNGQ